MAVKSKKDKKDKKKRSGQGKGRATITKRGDSGNETVMDNSVEISYPTDGSPHAEVGVSMGKRASKEGTYSSAAFEVSVKIPCRPGKEVEAGDHAVKLASEIFGKYEQDFENVVDSL